MVRKRRGKGRLLTRRCGIGMTAFVDRGERHSRRARLPLLAVQSKLCRRLARFAASCGVREEFDVSYGALWVDSGALRVVAGETFHSRYFQEDGGEAREADPRGGEEKDADFVFARAIQRALFSRGAAGALVRDDGTGAGRADGAADAEAGQEIFDGDGGAGV